MTQSERLIYLINYLKNESHETKSIPIPDNENDKRRLLRSLVNIRQPGPISAEFLQIQDAYLQGERQKPVTLDELEELEPNIYLWQGDITRLAVDAIVNAANSKMLGCFIPCHSCIDNVIHTGAGVQLRNECAQLMAGREEPVGGAEITKAYNLPCRYVIHTVGPMIFGAVDQEDCRLLASCYRACMRLATEYKLNSIAFCCISTGIFRFPNKPAAEIATQSARAFQKEVNPAIKVIFDVFTDNDYTIYKQLLGRPGAN